MDFETVLKDYGKKISDFYAWDQNEMTKLNSQRFKLREMEQKARQNRKKAVEHISMHFQNVLGLFVQREAAHKREMDVLKAELHESRKEIEEVRELSSQMPYAMSCSTHRRRNARLTRTCHFRSQIQLRSQLAKSKSARSDSETSENLTLGGESQKLIEEEKLFETSAEEMGNEPSLTDAKSFEKTAQRLKTILKVDNRHLKVYEHIGAGAYGNVYRCNFGGKDAAVKTLKSKDKSSQHIFMMEIKLDCTLSHPCTVRLCKFIGKGTSVMPREEE